MGGVRARFLYSAACRLSMLEKRSAIRFPLPAVARANSYIPPVCLRRRSAGNVCCDLDWFGLDQGRSVLPFGNDSQEFSVRHVLDRYVHPGLGVVAILPFVGIGVLEGKD